MPAGLCSSVHHFTVTQINLIVRIRAIRVNGIVSVAGNGLLIISDRTASTKVSSGYDSN